ncbi:MAG: cytidine deaminase [Elusimicrobia bacterium]|nr:cytidine deaminase [Elusimicrobiota bacterium]
MRRSIKKTPIEGLVAAALRARGRAYCPYSRYAVGAAVLTEAGRVFAGCNVESASYGLSMCAERVALYRAVAESGGGVRLKAVCVAADEARPCGACRQLLFEFSGAGTSLYLMDVGAGGRRALTRTTVLRLLPRAFAPAALKTRRPS